MKELRNYSKKKMCVYVCGKTNKNVPEGRCFVCHKSDETQTANLRSSVWDYIETRSSEAEEQRTRYRRLGLDPVSCRHAIEVHQVAALAGLVKSAQTGWLHAMENATAFPSPKTDHLLNQHGSPRVGRTIAAPYRSCRTTSSTRRFRALLAALSLEANGR